MRLVLLVGMLFFVAACPPPCDRSNCTGCCEPGGECLPGTSRNYCGKGGVVCGVCASPQRCQASMCVDPVDAGPPDAGPIVLNCAAGCRVENDCQPGNLPEACGADGGVCSVCDPSTRCEAGRCVMTACLGCFDALGSCRPGTSDSLACGGDGGFCQACSPGNTCRSGRCAVQACTNLTCPMGCCRAGVCLASSLTSCGIGGATCTTCQPGELCTSSGICR